MGMFTAPRELDGLESHGGGSQKACMHVHSVANDSGVTGKHVISNLGLTCY